MRAKKVLSPKSFYSPREDTFILALAGSPTRHLLQADFSIASKLNSLKALDMSSHIFTTGLLWPIGPFVFAASITNLYVYHCTGPSSAFLIVMLATMMLGGMLVISESQ